MSVHIPGLCLKCARRYSCFYVCMEEFLFNSQRWNLCLLPTLWIYAALDWIIFQDKFNTSCWLKSFHVWKMEIYIVGCSFGIRTHTNVLLGIFIWKSFLSVYCRQVTPCMCKHVHTSHTQWHTSSCNWILPCGCWHFCFVFSKS
jgi:hypothetical protein